MYASTVDLTPLAINWQAVRRDARRRAALREAARVARWTAAGVAAILFGLLVAMFSAGR